MQKELNKAIKEVPYRMLRELIAQKIKDEGITPSKELLDQLVAHIRSESLELFTWKDDSKDQDRSITLSFTDEDLKELQEKVGRFLNEDLTDIVEKTSDSMAESILETLIDQWPDRHQWEQTEMEAFRYRLEERWGEPIGLLRMLLTIIMELGAELYKKNRRRKAGKTHLYNVLLRLHCRACQVTGEIITLLENGYADGAMARWRTLHEIATVAGVLVHFGEDIAERYMAHEAVESKRAFEDYERCHAALGHRPPSNRDRKAVDREYNAVLRKYGAEFQTHYGWAAHHLGKSRPTLAHLEEIAGKASLRSYYQMASYNIHASPKGLFFRLGLLDNYDGVHSGVSNAGLDEPGTSTAFTLVQITGLLFEPAKMKLDDTVNLVMLGQLRDKIANAFTKADRQLRRDEIAFQKKRAARRT